MDTDVKMTAAVTFLQLLITHSSQLHLHSHSICKKVVVDLPLKELKFSIFCSLSLTFGGNSCKMEMFFKLVFAETSSFFKSGMKCYKTFYFVTEANKLECNM